jgi:hypothetical protein
MLEPTQIGQWLRAVDQHEAASIVEQCSLRADFVDLIEPIGGGSEVEIFNIVLETPGHIFKRLNSDLVSCADQVEYAVRGCAAGIGFSVRYINWVPRVPPVRSEAELSIERLLSSLNSESVRQAWNRALERKQGDPAGAITAARTLLETVFRHILDEAEVEYSSTDTMPALYHRISELLGLLPKKQEHEGLRRLLGACQSVVDNVTFIRNSMGDAHGRSRSDALATPEQAGLAVNSAGTIAMFLVETWNKVKPSVEGSEG